MTQYLIGVLVGSLREDSFNRKTTIRHQPSPE